MSDIETGLLQLGAGGPCPVDTLATSKSPERRRSATFRMSGFCPYSLYGTWWAQPAPSDK